MYKFILSLIFTTLFISSETITFSQEMEDVIYLKNGSIIHGTIIEQIPNESIKIKTKDGNVFVYKMEEIEKMTKEEIKKEREDRETTTSEKKSVINYSGFGIRGGLGTDITLGLAFGIGAYYDLASSPYNSTSWEFGGDFYYHKSTEEEKTTSYGWTELDKEETQLIIITLKGNGLFNYRPGRPGVHFIAGTGIVIASVSFEETETFTYIEPGIYQAPNHLTADGVAVGNIFNLGLGAGFGGGLEARLETPLFIFYSTYGNAATIVPTFTLSVLYRFP